MKWQNYSAAALDFSELCREVFGKFSVAPQNVEEAYKVWQLSRGGTEEKFIATIPRNISFANAKSFLSVFSGAQPQGGRRTKAEQVAAPIIFEQNGDLIGVRSTSEVSDNLQVVQAGAAALNRQVDRFLLDHPVMNVVPSSRDMLKAISNELETVVGGEYDDGVIISIALQFNAFQWHVDSVRENISDSKLGELTGLFATAHLFLRRFAIWHQYIGMELDDGTPVDSLAEFRIAKSILSSASTYENLLDDSARTRVGVVLSRAPSENSPPAFLDGVVRSGDNLAAFALNRASQIAVAEAKDFAKTAKGEAYKMGSKAVISFASDNAENLVRLAQARQWPWAQWAMAIVKAVVDL